MKIFLTGIIAILLASSATSVALSQNPNNKSNPTQPIASENDPYSSQLSSIKKPEIVHLNEVSSKAVRYFIKTYKNVDSVKWSRLTDGKGGFAASFSADGIPTIVLYDKSGNYEYCLREYFEDKLPREIRHRVKSTYYDFTICFIREVTMCDNTVYAITLEDPVSWKNILITEFKIVVLKEFLKTSPDSVGN